MLARLSAFVIWALIAGTVVFWGFRLVVRPEAPPRHTVVMGDGSMGRVDLTRLFGAPPVVESVSVAPPPVSSRFRLIGIMAPRVRGTASPSHGGLALIAVDGKPPRAYAVGAKVDPDLVLQSVTLRTASIGSTQGGQTMLLQIPPFAAPATGVPPSFAGGGGAPAAPGSLPPGMPPGSASLPIVTPPISPPEERATGMRPLIPQNGAGQPQAIAPAMAPPQHDPGALTQ